MGSRDAPGVDAKSHGGYTPLHVAAMNSQYEAIELLVAVYKADVDATDFSGHKPIYYFAARDVAAVPGQRSSTLLRRLIKH